jgi:hypothetical protein
MFNNLWIVLAALSLPLDLETNNVVDTKADAVYTYSGRTVTISWCHPRTDVTFDFQVVDMLSETIEVFEIGLTVRSYAWVVPRTGQYMFRLRTRYPDDQLTGWNDSITNGNVVVAGCTVEDSFLLNALIAPPTGGGGFEQ